VSTAALFVLLVAFALGLAEVAVPHFHTRAALAVGL
jgi:hypothetical protein